jgi:hypothetical protein
LNLPHGSWLGLAFSLQCLIAGCKNEADLYKFPAGEKAKVTQTILAMRRLQKATEVFRMDRGRCPASIDELVRVGVLKLIPLDAWGEQLIFACPGKHSNGGADIASKGHDREEGTADDIDLWLL